MRQNFSETALNHFRESIQFSIRFTFRMAEKKKMEQVCESIIQIIRDIYLYRKGFYLQDSVLEGLTELQAALTEEEMECLRLIELSLRKEEDYFKISRKIGKKITLEILKKLENCFFA